MQAMAIYGQMTSRPSREEGEGEEGEEEEGDIDESVRQVTAEATKDLENVLSHLSDTIGDLTSNKPLPSAPPTSRPPHLTLASSPTNPRGGPDISPPRDSTIV